MYYLWLHFLRCIPWDCWARTYHLRSSSAWVIMSVQFNHSTIVASAPILTSACRAKTAPTTGLRNFSTEVEMPVEITYPIDNHNVPSSPFQMYCAHPVDGSTCFDNCNVFMQVCKKKCIQLSYIIVGSLDNNILVYILLYIPLNSEI